MKGLLSLGKSRKFWVTMFGVALALFKDKINLNQNQIITIAGLLAWLCFTIAYEDKKNLFKNILEGVNVSIPDDGSKDYKLEIDLGKTISKLNKAKKEAEAKPKEVSDSTTTDT